MRIACSRGGEGTGDVEGGEYGNGWLIASLIKPIAFCHPPPFPQALRDELCAVNHVAFIESRIGW